MKHFIQFVAVFVIALLAIPPAVAEGICLLAQDGQHSSMNCCDTVRVGSTDAPTPATMMQDCTEGCCSVAPAQTPAPSAPDRLKSDVPVPGVQQSIAVQPQHTACEMAPPASQASTWTADSQSLLQTYRI